MKAVLVVCSFVWSLVLAQASFGQQAVAQQAPAGIAAVWETAENIGQFVTGAARLKPLLDQMTPREWVAKGASETYLTQWQDARTEIEYLEAAARLFQGDPEKLTAALDTLFRWQNVEFRMESLIEAVRKYQNPAVGDLILGVLRSNSSNRDSLRQYIAQLAALKEQEAQVAEEEAQRCRVDLLRPAASPAKRNTQK